MSEEWQSEGSPAEFERVIHFKKVPDTFVTSVRNGIWLPESNKKDKKDKNGNVIGPSENPKGRVFHNQTKTPKYYMWVDEQFRSVERTTDAFEKKLKVIHDLLDSGQTPWIKT